MHVCQPWTNVPRYTTKPQTLRFSSHRSVLNFAGTALHVPSFECVKYVKISVRGAYRELSPDLSRINFLGPSFFGINFYSQKRAQPPGVHGTQKKYPKSILGPWAWTSLDKVPVVKVLFIPGPTSSVLNFAGTALHVTPRMWANPSWTNAPRHTTKPQTPRFASHTSVLNFAGTALYIIPHMCAKPQTLRFSSHTSLFWTFVEQLSILHHACVPTLNHCSKIHHKTSDPKIFISHICVELCRNNSPCYTTHVSQPILNQCPQTHHKTSDPKICISHIEKPFESVELCWDAWMHEQSPHARLCRTGLALAHEHTSWRSLHLVFCKYVKISVRGAYRELSPDLSRINFLGAKFFSE